MFFLVLSSKLSLLALFKTLEALDLDSVDPCLETTFLTFFFCLSENLSDFFWLMCWAGFFVWVGAVLAIVEAFEVGTLVVGGFVLVVCLDAV